MRKKKSCWSCRSCRIYCFLRFGKTLENSSKHFPYKLSNIFSKCTSTGFVASLVWNSFTLLSSSRKLLSDIVVLIGLVVFMLLIAMLIMSDTGIAFKFHVVSYSANSAYSLNSYHIVIWCQFKDWLCFSSCWDIPFTKYAALRVYDKMLLRALWHSGTWLG